jgi:hypothetical protein
MLNVNSSIAYEDFLRFHGAEDKGKYIVMACPFHHDNSPSLLVFKDGFFHCLGAECARSGTWQTLWNKLKGQPIQITAEKRIHYRSPARMLEDDFGGREEGAYQSYLDLVRWPTFQWYLELRGLQDAIDIHEIGYHRGWYLFPVRDRDYKFENVIFRAAPHVQDAIDMRYWADGKPSMFVPDWHLLDKCDYILIVFGILDALTLNKFRMPVVSPTHGHLFDPNWLNPYRKPIYVMPDKGEERKALQLTANLGWRGQMVRLDWPLGMKDSNDFLKSGRQDELLSQLSQVIR